MTTDSSTPFQPPSFSFTPSGDLRRDLFHFRELYYRHGDESGRFPTMTPSMGQSTDDASQDSRLLDAIKYTLEKPVSVPENEINAQNTTSGDDDSAPSAPNEPENVEDLSNLPDEDLNHVLASLHLQNLTLSPQDELALANGIRTCAFHINEVRLLSVKVPSLVLLCRALQEKRSLQLLAFDMSHERQLRDGTSGADASQSFGSAELVNDEMAQRLQEANASNQKKGSKGAASDSSAGPTPYNIPSDILFETPLVAPLMTCARHISLRGCSLNDDAIQNLAKILRNHNTIQTLSLWGNEITDRGAGYIARALRTNHSLIGLDIGMNRFTDEGAQKIIQAFESEEVTGLDTLQEMRLEAYQSILGPHQFSSAEQLPMPAHLLPVILGKKAKAPKTPHQTHLWDEQIQVLSAPEEADPKKKKANDEQTAETPFVFQVSGNKTLQYLSFAGSIGVTDSTGRQIAKLLKEVDTLHQVALTQTRVTDECLQEVLHSLNSRNSENEDSGAIEEEDQ
mmetsp:Transcript_3474/g.13255  ORF Transcript_3474/g.13255 Transcript_3474/m.13255 type:complete len:510 (-) Transcript_3474:64-1593(-)